MKHLLASTCLVAGLLAMTGAARAECGDVTIASMNWQSAEVLAALDKFILTEGYGCNAEVIVGDTVPTITSMIEKGEPDLAPEGWVDLLPDVVNRGIEEGKLIGAAVALSDAAVQGWWIPKYIADANPVDAGLDERFRFVPDDGALDGEIRFRPTPTEGANRVVDAVVELVAELRDQADAALSRGWDRIQAILEEAGVPLIDLPPPTESLGGRG